MKKPLSKSNLNVLRLINNFCKVKYFDLAKKLGISHTAVREHVDNLIRKNYSLPSSLINLSKLRFKMVILPLEVATLDDMNKLITCFRNCPKGIIHMFRIIGEYITL